MEEKNQNFIKYEKLSSLIKNLSIDMVENANSGHPGAPMGMADFITVLFSKYFQFNPNNSKWINRDILIFSNGHASALLYSLLYSTGYSDITLNDLKQFRQLGSKTAGHPEFGHLQGIECTTGPLGQGFANSVGFAIASKKLQSQFGEQIINNKVYVTIGDGCMMEGISHEAASLAGHLKLNNLVAMFDSNAISIDGSTNLSDSTNVKMRFESYGWNVIEAAGHDFYEIENAFEKANKFSDNSLEQNLKKPILIIFKTIIGKGANKKSGSASSHGAPLGKDEMHFAKNELFKILELDQSKIDELFLINDDVLKDWRGIFDSRIKNFYSEWTKNFNENTKKRDQILNFFSKDFLASSKFCDLFDEFFKQYNQSSGKQEATRKSSGLILERLIQNSENFIGGSADLGESNCVLNKFSKKIDSSDFSGNYLHYGVREHAAAAINNGIACYCQGLIPFSAGFLIFSDYARPSIRLSALMGLQVFYIFTHDSIGVGEDGPTHQPIEHLASFRAMPNLLVFRPCDSLETIYAYKIALLNQSTPSLFSLSRQNLKQLKDLSEEKDFKINEDHIFQGAHIISEYNELEQTDKTKKVIIFSAGSEIQIALDVKKKLLLVNENLQIRVVSMFCTALFDKASKDFQNFILDVSDEHDFSGKTLRVAIEAASSLPWHKYIGLTGMFFGMDGIFGASGKGDDLFKNFDLNFECISNKILNKLL